MEILKINVGDTIELKKKHPCGSAVFKIARVGSDVRIICQGCGCDITLDRIKLEKSIRHILNQN